MSNRFYILDCKELDSRYLFEVYETLDRVVILCTRGKNNFEKPESHNYFTMKSEEARRVWTCLISPNKDGIRYTRNRKEEAVANGNR